MAVLDKATKTPKRPDQPYIGNAGLYHSDKNTQ